MIDLKFYPTIEQSDKDSLQDAVVVVIDVLRSSSSIIAAIENGASRVIPVVDIETASRLVEPQDKSRKLLAGERRGEMIEGFDLGNSPLEFTRDVVSGKTIVLTTSNGTRGVVVSSKAKRVLVTALNNLHAVVDEIRHEDNVAILCSGDEGNLSAEDLLCGGMIIEELADSIDRKALNDAARISLILSERYESKLEDFLLMTDRGRQLVARGYRDDIAHCSRLDISHKVPELKDGSIVA